MVAGSSSTSSTVNPSAVQSAAIWAPTADSVGLADRRGTRSLIVRGCLAAAWCQPSFALLQPAAARDFAAAFRLRAIGGVEAGSKAHDEGGISPSAGVA